GARLRSFARGAERPAAGDMLEHDPAAAFRIALPHEAERCLDALGIVVGCICELLHRQRRRGDDEQRLQRAGELVERITGDQAERSVHAVVLSSSSRLSFPARAILIGANGAGCSIVISPERRSSSSARNATACSIRGSSLTSWSKSKRERRRSTERNRSRNCVTGGKRSAMCAR